MGEDWVEIVKNALVIVGAPVALAGAWKALRELALGTREKAKENRIRQALAARDMLKDLFASAKARAALQMLDWSGRSYSDGDHEFEVRATDLGDALRTDRLAFDHKQMFIRDCFEELFDRIEQLQHFVNIGLLHFDDVALPLEYYARKIVADLPAFEPFLLEYGYPNAHELLTRAGGR
jgi:hypothetical protein